VNASTAAAAAAHKRIKRALGLLRGAAAALAPLADELDLVGEVHLEQGQTNLDELLAVLRVARERHGALDVIVLAAPRALPPAPAAPLPAELNVHS
jgi:hypothetical protein